jgi:hypothetical protein
VLAGTSGSKFPRNTVTYLRQVEASRQGLARRSKTQYISLYAIFRDYKGIKKGNKMCRIFICSRISRADVCPYIDLPLPWLGARYLKNTSESSSEAPKRGKKTSRNLDHPASSTPRLVVPTAPIPLSPAFNTVCVISCHSWNRDKGTVASIKVRTSPVTRGSPCVIFERHLDSRSPVWLRFE